MGKPPLLYYRTREQIEAYRKVPALQKIKKLEMEMEFLYYAMPDKSKRTKKVITGKG